MMNTTNKQARCVVIGHSVQVNGAWVAVTGTEHVYSYNNPSRRRTVAEVTLKLEGGRAIKATGMERVPVAW